jgi:hypothetical protein
MSAHEDQQQRPDEQTPAGKQHGDPLLSTTQGQPEQGSRHGFAPDETPRNQEQVGDPAEPSG